MYPILIVNFSAQAAFPGDMQSCPRIVIDFSHNIYVVRPFSLCAGAAEAACSVNVHLAMDSLYTNFEKLLLLLECNTAR